MQLISKNLFFYVEPKRISSESKHSPSEKETSRKKILKFPWGLPSEYKAYKLKTICKNFIETVLSIHERIRKSRALGTNKQVSSSNICKYNLLRKTDILLKRLYHQGKVSKLLRVQELWCRKCILYRKKANVYHKLERKGQSTMACARPKRPNSTT